jgi:hypothetical protein
MLPKGESAVGRMHVLARGLVVIALTGSYLVTFQGQALAACHAFSVSVAPSSPSEGGTVTVTVSRDGAVLPSSIKVATVDGSAKTGKDYTSVNKRIEFTNDVEQAFTVSTLNDKVHETTESFKLHLSDPQGCNGAGYVVGPDATVTIKDNDAAPVASHTSTPTATATAEPEPRHASQSPTPSAKPSPRASRSSTPKQSASPRSTASAVAAAAENGGGSSRGILIGMAGALVIAIAAAFGIKRFRRV